ncbi:MAG: hypothetical protein ACYTGH_16355, partial [Planctomycetota bacterium]
MRGRGPLSIEQEGLGRIGVGGDEGVGGTGGREETVKAQANLLGIHVLAVDEAGPEATSEVSVGEAVAVEPVVTVEAVVERPPNEGDTPVPLRGEPVDGAAGRPHRIAVHHPDEGRINHLAGAGEDTAADAGGNAGLMKLSQK